MITQDIVKSTYEYDPDHPLAIRWKAVSKYSHSISVGQIAGHWHPVRAKSPILHRFAVVGDHRRVPVSHIVWIYFHGIRPTCQLWFKDGNPGDCRIDNLSDSRKRRSPEELRAIRKKYVATWRGGFTEEAWSALLRERSLRNNYGISTEDYQRMFAAQGGVCAVCKRPETMMRHGMISALSVDHCHTTNKVRGLLCVNCNNGIGRFQDRPEMLRRAAEYLEGRTTVAPH